MVLTLTNPAELYHLQNRTTRHNATKLQDMSYAYDAVGNLTLLIDTSASSTAKTVAYTYDDLHRLTSASTTNATSTNYRETYTYSTIGNLTNKSDQGTYSYNGASELLNYANPHAATSINGSALIYDRAGNLTSGQGRTHAWDYLQHLTSTAQGGATTTYTYLPNGDRLTQTIGTATTTYISSHYDLTDTPDSTHARRTLWAGDLPLVVVDGPEFGFGEFDGPEASPEVYYLHLDHLGSTQAVTNETATLTELTDYYPYGQLKFDYSTTFTEPRKFTGHEYDEATDLNYMEARYQEGGRGRFLSQDPHANFVPKGQKSH